MSDIYKLLANEKQCKRYLMKKEQDGTCSYCVEGLIAKTLNLPEYEWEPGKYSFGDPSKESIDLYTLPTSVIEAAGFPGRISCKLLELLDLCSDIKSRVYNQIKWGVESIPLTELNDMGITFQQFAVLFEALGIPHAD